MSEGVREREGGRGKETERMSKRIRTGHLMWKKDQMGKEGQPLAEDGVSPAHPQRYPGERGRGGRTCVFAPAAVTHVSVPGAGASASSASARTCGLLGSIRVRAFGFRVY